MGRPAARVGDQTTPPHTPLIPGPGSSTVLIGDRPAWRTNVDTSMCATPPPPPHGAEICYLGSLSVMINDQMAVRQGDTVIGGGGPNRIVLGLNSVLIGDIGFGLADPARMAEFCKDFGKLALEWHVLKPHEREAWLEAIINKQLAKSGVPYQYLRGASQVRRRLGFYDFPNGAIVISQKALDAPRLSRAGARALANAVYHEGRHAEQWYLMARQQAGLGSNIAQIQSSLKVPLDLATAAHGAPLTGTSAAQNLAGASYQSVYGHRGLYRKRVYEDNKLYGTRGAEKIALPEEQDALNAGESLPCVRS
jgi:uncharacterized Zn-binding protein involved in type VI secretion